MAIPFLDSIDLNSNRILNLPAPASNNEPARLADLNSAIEGLAPKDSCRVSTQGNINLSSPGSTIDAGITMAPLDRVLVRQQSTASQNGIYIWNGAASAMTRSPDADTAAELEAAITTVEEGTDAGTTWRQTSVNFTLGSGNVVWVAFGNAVSAASESNAGIAEIATQAETDTGTDDARIVTPAKLANLAGRYRRTSAVIGDGSSTQFDVTHNFGSRDVSVEVYRNSVPHDTIFATVSRPSVNAVRLNFGAAVASNAYVVVVSY